MDLEFLFYPRFLFIKKSESFGSWSCCCASAQEGDCTNIISINQTILCFVDNRKMWIWNLVIFLFISITFYLKFYIPNVPLPQLLISQYSQLFLKWKRSPILYQISAIQQPNMERYVKDKIIKLSGYFIELLKMSRSMFYYLLSIHSLSTRLELMTAS